MNNTVLYYNPSTVLSGGGVKTDLTHKYRLSSYPTRCVQMVACHIINCAVGHQMAISYDVVSLYVNPPIQVLWDLVGDRLPHMDNLGVQRGIESESQWTRSIKRSLSAACVLNYELRVTLSTYCSLYKDLTIRNFYEQLGDPKVSRFHQHRDTNVNKKYFSLLKLKYVTFHQIHIFEI